MLSGSGVACWHSMELFQTDVEESVKIQEFQDEKVGEYFVQFHDTDFILCPRTQAISILDMTWSVCMYVPNPSVTLDIQQIQSLCSGQT